MPVKAEVILGVQTYARLIRRAVNRLYLGVAVAVDKVEGEELDGSGLLLLVTEHVVVISDGAGLSGLGLAAGALLTAGPLLHALGAALGFRGRLPPFVLRVWPRDVS